MWASYGSLCTRFSLGWFIKSSFFSRTVDFGSIFDGSVFFCRFLSLRRTDNFHYRSKKLSDKLKRLQQNQFALTTRLSHTPRKRYKVQNHTHCYCKNYQYIIVESNLFMRERPLKDTIFEVKRFVKIHEFSERQIPLRTAFYHNYVSPFVLLVFQFRWIRVYGLCASARNELNDCVISMMI